MTETIPTEYKKAFELAIPEPTLRKSFRLVCDLEAVRNLGSGLSGDGGAHWITFTGGYVSSNFGLTAKILPGGQDSQKIYSPLHPSNPLAAQLSTRYLLETIEEEEGEGVFIKVETRGWRTGKKEILEKLSKIAQKSSSSQQESEAGGEGEGREDTSSSSSSSSASVVDVPGPDEYKFRLFIEMETDSKNEKYAWLNTAMFVGSGSRSGRQVIYDAYLVE
ncbi:hypothetical protein JCM3765_002791 [Sporobolomyces pararoseus]